MAATRQTTFLLLIASTCLLGVRSFAADLAPIAPAPSAEEAIAAASPWMVRVRGLGVITRDSGSINGVPGAGL